MEPNAITYIVLAAVIVFLIIILMKILPKEDFYDDGSDEPQEELSKDATQTEIETCVSPSRPPSAIATSSNDGIVLSEREIRVISAYRSDKNMQVAIDRLLCVDSQTPNATQEQTKSKYIKCKIGFLFSASLIYGIIYASVKSSNVTLPTIATALILTVLILSAWYLSDFIAPKPKK